MPPPPAWYLKPRLLRLFLALGVAKGPSGVVPSKQPRTVGLALTSEIEGSGGDNGGVGAGLSAKKLMAKAAELEAAPREWSVTFVHQSAWNIRAAATVHSASLGQVPSGTTVTAVKDSTPGWLRLEGPTKAR